MPAGQLEISQVIWMLIRKECTDYLQGGEINTIEVGAARPQSPHPAFRLRAAINARSKNQEHQEREIEIRRLRGEVKFVEPTR